MVKVLQNVPSAPVEEGMVLELMPGKLSYVTRIARSGALMGIHVMGTDGMLQHHSSRADDLKMIPSAPPEIPVHPVEPEVWKAAIHPSVMYAKYSCTVGSDPEIFAVDSAGKLLPAFWYLGPKSESVLGPQEFYDGFQAEWTTKPTGCLGYQMDNVRAGMLKVRDALRRFDPDARLSMASVLDIPDEVRVVTPPERFILGCSPSENAYGEEPLQLENPAALGYRTAGWHMHFGLSNPGDPQWELEKKTYIKLPPDQAHAAVRMLDRVIGVGMVAFGRGHHDPRRRELYGKAGEYRVGRTLEYRVPDVILGAHPITWNLLWDLARVVMQVGLKGMEFLWNAEDDETRYIINKYDVDLADRALRRNEPMLRKFLERSYAKTQPETPTFNPQAPIDYGVRALYEGIDSVVKNPTDIEGNWGLDDTNFPKEGFHYPSTIWRRGAMQYLAHGAKV